MTVNESLLPDGKIRLLYRVADTGLGMSEEFQAEMYNMFARETDSRINNTQGTGLVLPIVKQLVDLMKVPSPATVLLEKAQLLPSLWIWRNPVLKSASISAPQIAQLTLVPK